MPLLRQTINFMGLGKKAAVLDEAKRRGLETGTLTRDEVIAALFMNEVGLDHRQHEEILGQTALYVGIAKRRFLPDLGLHETTTKEVAIYHYLRCVIKQADDNDDSSLVPQTRALKLADKTPTLVADGTQDQTGGSRSATTTAAGTSTPGKDQDDGSNNGATTTTTITSGKDQDGGSNNGTTTTNTTITPGKDQVGGSQGSTGTNTAKEHQEEDHDSGNASKSTGESLRDNTDGDDAGKTTKKRSHEDDDEEHEALQASKKR